MLDIMSQADNAVEAYNTNLRAISSNVTNLSIPGYKRTNITFQEVYAKIVKSGTGSTFYGEEGGTDPQQTGGTAAIASSNIDFSQGDITGSGVLSLAIQGNGLFIVSPDNGDNFLYTRNGEFQLVNNKLLTSDGMQVYGFYRSGSVTSGQLVPIDLSYETISDPNKVSWNANGVLIRSSVATDADYNVELPYQIALTSFSNPSGLEYRNGTSFAFTLASGDPQTPATPGTNNLGTVSPQSKEQSNVVYTTEIVDSLEMQRAISASLTVIRLINDTITQFIQKIS